MEHRFRTVVTHAEPADRLIALSDIHGRADLFAALLNRLDLRDEDMLVIAGDLVERGPQSLETVRMAMRLAKRPNTVVLMGNMDAHIVLQTETDTEDAAKTLLRYEQGHGASLFGDMCRELGLPCETAGQIAAAKAPVRRAFAAELAFLAARPTILETPFWTFVHGGLPSPDVESLAGTDAVRCMKFDDFAGKGPVCRKNTVVGHYPVGLYRPGALRLDPLFCPEKKILSIDGGCGLREEGQLNAVFCHPDGTYTHIAEDGLPLLEAAEPQSPLAPTVRFRWPHGGARLLEERGGEALVEQTDTALRCLVPERFLRRSAGSDLVSVNDFSDARLSVSPGDRLSLIARTDRGVYAKKDGVSGWYFGKTKQITP